MDRLRRNGWWALLAMAVIIGLFGLGDLAMGAEADPGIALGLTGMTLAELEAASAEGFRLYDFGVRAGGLHLVVIGVAMSAVLWFGFRRGERWAWWTAWSLPAWSAGVFVMNLAAGVAPGQAPPPPMISGPIFAALGAAILVMSAPRFFRPGAPAREPHLAPPNPVPR